MTSIIVFEKKNTQLINKKYFQLKGNLNKRVKMKFYKLSFSKIANFNKYFLCEQLIQIANSCLPSMPLSPFSNTTILA